MVVGNRISVSGGCRHFRQAERSPEKDTDIFLERHKDLLLRSSLVAESILRQDQDKFLEAVQNENIPIIQRYLSAEQAERVITSYIGQRALVIAAQKGNKDLVQQLLLNPKIKLRNIELAGINYSNYRMINLCIKVGVWALRTLGVIQSASRMPPQALIMAASYGHTHLVKYFLSHPEAKAKDREEALYAALTFGQLDLVKELMFSGELSWDLLEKLRLRGHLPRSTQGFVLDYRQLIDNVKKSVTDKYDNLASLSYEECEQVFSKFRLYENRNQLSILCSVNKHARILAATKHEKAFIKLLSESKPSIEKLEEKHSKKAFYSSKEILFSDTIEFEVLRHYRSPWKEDLENLLRNLSYSGISNQTWSAYFLCLKDQSKILPLDFFQNDDGNVSVRFGSIALALYEMGFLCY